MLKKLYDKDAIWFAVGWIIVYVVGFANADMLSESMGMPKLLTVAVGAALSLVLLSFVYRNGLSEKMGLCSFRGNYRDFLWFAPLAVISSVNFWNGVTVNVPPLETVLYIVSMCFVGLLEEVIFRGLLFRGMCAGNVKAAITVSSLTFGVGHIVNLLTGAPLYETLLQLVYASAIGFCYTVMFQMGGSIVPCILSHIFVNATSVFAVEPSQTGSVVTALVQTVLGVGYGLWLLKRAGEQEACRRIAHMEAIYDTLRNSVGGESGMADARLLAELTAYYEGGQWRKDYELDEQGLLPPTLKRGVLSQDGVYDLLAQIRKEER